MRMLAVVYGASGLRRKTTRIRTAGERGCWSFHLKKPKHNKGVHVNTADGETGTSMRLLILQSKEQYFLLPSKNIPSLIEE